MATTVSRSRSRSPTPQLEISALADTVRIHQAALNWIPTGTNPSSANSSSDWLRTVITETAAIAASLREIGPRISPVDRSLQRNYQILGLDLECLQDRVNLLISHICKKEREMAAKQASSITNTSSSLAPALTSSSISPDRETLMMGLLSDPKTLFCYGGHPRLPYLKGFPNLVECHCINGFRREEMRTGIPNCRQIAEDALIRMIHEKFPLSQHREIFLCSIASAMCLQESVIHAKLKALGYTVNWLLVDPIYTMPGGKDVIDDFRRLTTIVDGAEGATQISYLPSIDHLSEEGLKHLPRKPDVFIAIDLDGLGESTIKASQPKLRQMERRIESLTYPHIYLYADKRVLDDVVPHDLLTDNTHGRVIRPTVAITYIHPSSGIQRRVALGPLAWDSRNYEDLRKEKDDPPQPRLLRPSAR